MNRSFLVLGVTFALVAAWPSEAAHQSDAQILKNCPPEGDTQIQIVQDLNKLKRRMTVPSAADVDQKTTMAAMLTHGDDTDRWNSGRGATIEGYVAVVKPGDKESVNCHTATVQYKDTHIELTLEPNANDEKTYVIVEVTPQVREKMALQGKDWSTSTLRTNLLGRWVKITGWLLFDVEHKPNAVNTNPHGTKLWRATAWEIHPITDIAVLPSRPH